MSIDQREFLENYINETRENLQLLDDVVIQLRKSPEDRDKLSELMRILHSIKGASRMMKYTTLEKIAHGLEDIFRGVREDRYKITKPLIQLVLSSSDYLDRGMEKILAEGSDEMNISRLLAIYEKAMAGLTFSLEQLEEERGGQAPEKKTGGDSGESGTHRDYESIRIKISKIDEIIRKLNGLIIQQFQFKREVDYLQSLDDTLHKSRSRIHELAEKYPELADIDSDIADAAKNIQRINKSYSEEMVQLEHTSFELQEMILGLRMLPMDLVISPLKKMIEEIALALDKEIDFITMGTDLLLDKTILEQINDPIIHLVRNSIDHGIESADERKAAGKPETGKVSIICSAESGRINIEISDDGRGLDYDKIRNKALTLYPEASEEIREMDDGSLSSLLFRSGFSTKSEITSLSGRGVGLDIVKSNIEEVKGKITLKSEPGNGAVFTLSLPLSLATVDGFFVASQGERFLIPATFVREILIIEKEDIMNILNRNVIRVRDKIIPVYPLSALLQKDISTSQNKFSVVLVESLGDEIGIIVDAVVQFSSLIYKPLPGNMAKLKALQGVVFDENFDIINILYVPDLINRFKGVRSIEFRKRFSAQERDYKQILVVDDSLSTREIEKSILELDGYNVELAVDGIDALEKMKDSYFHLILTDINMPRMDGLTLIENIRRQEKFSSTPIVVVSSEADLANAERIKKTGASALFDKRDFDRGNLLHTVKQLIG